MTFRAPLVRWLPQPPPRQDWIWSTPDTLLSPPFRLTEWPNPLARAPLRQDFIAGTPDTLLNPPGLTPFYLLDWPNPTGYPFPIEDRTWLQGVNLSANPPPAPTLPFSLTEWANPAGYTFPVEDRGYVQSTNLCLGVPEPVVVVSRGTGLRRMHEERIRLNEETIILIAAIVAAVDNG